MWPAFAGLTVFDGLFLHERPIAGEHTGVVEGLLLGCFFNLVAVAVLAPMVGAVVRRRWRPDLPRIVAHDYAGTALLVAVSVGLVAAGLAHHPAVREGKADFRAQAVAVHDYVLAQAPAYAGQLSRATTLRLEADLYRTCVPGGDRRRLCLLVNTDQSPPGVRRDPSAEPNENLGRNGAYRP
jgi:hypothetical protein